MKMLLAAGACIHARDRSGWTALHHAAAVGDLHSVQILLSAGAKVKVGGRSSLSVAGTCTCRTIVVVCRC